MIHIQGVGGSNPPVATKKYFMREINNVLYLYGTYGIMGTYIDYTDYILESIKKESNVRLYNQVMRSMMSKSKREKRDRQMHLI